MFGTWKIRLLFIRTIENKRERDYFTRMFISETNDTKMELKVKDLGKQDLFALLNYWIMFRNFNSLKIIYN